MTPSCLVRATGSSKTFLHINLRCNYTVSLPGGRSHVLPFEFHWTCYLEGPRSWVTCHSSLLLAGEMSLAHRCQKEPLLSSAFCYWLSDKGGGNESFSQALPSSIAEITLSLMHSLSLVSLQIAPSTQLWCLETPASGFAPKVPLPFCYQKRSVSPDCCYLRID